MVRRPSVSLFVASALVLAVAIPVLAVKPSTAPGQAKEKAQKAPITLRGTVETSTDADGQATYTITSGGKTYTLEAGPRWFFGNAYPLKKYVGDSVTIEGKVAAGSTDVDVATVNGVALRDEGKPPWAGGWKRIGALHPGWSQDKADRFDAKFGDCWPPGHCKDKTKPGADDSAEPSTE